MLRTGLNLLAAAVLGLLLTGCPERSSETASSDEKCLVRFGGGEPQGREVLFFEFSDEAGKGRHVCGVNSSITHGRVIGSDVSSYLIDAGTCKGWVSRDQVAQVRCE